MEDKKKKPEKIEIDKKFFDDIIEANKVILEKIKKLEEAGSGSVAPPMLNNEIDYLFQCVEIMFLDKGATPQDIMNAKPRIMEFRKELETLMKKFRVASTSALFLKKL